MKKKKRNSAAGAAASVGGTPVTAMDPDGDIKTLIHEHALFFDKLIELIPARFYLPTDNQDKVWFQGLSKKEKAEAKQKSIENTKKSRRDRLDPEKPSKSTLDLLKETLESGKLEDPSKEENVGSLIDDDDDDDDVDGTVKVGNRDSGDQSVTYEELRERLHKKIEELRAGRGGGENKEKREEKKRKRNEEWTKKHEGGNREAEERESERAMEEEVDEAAKGIRFGKVKLGEEERETRMKKKKKKKMTKEEELENALKLEEAKRDPNKGEFVAKKQSWKAAKERAMGKKVHDNPKLIKESIQKAKRRQKKSAEKWRERVQTTEKMKQERQDKRKENIKNKIEKKRMKKIERREKKLMRPGFEGRKEGFINGD